MVGFLCLLTFAYYFAYLLITWIKKNPENRINTSSRELTKQSIGESNP